MNLLLTEQNQTYKMHFFISKMKTYTPIINSYSVKTQIILATENFT